MAKGEIDRLFVALGLDDAEFQKSFKKTVKDLKEWGKMVTAMGGAISGALALSVKAAAEEEEEIAKLDQALKNVGESYDKVKKSLEDNIAATQKKTSIGDGEQRKSLQRLLETTGDYKRSLDLLPLALDLATAKGMDAASASEIVGRVAAGNTSILSRYGIQLKEGATATEALAAMQQKYGGQAEAYGKTLSGQINLLKNSFGDLMEQIGGVLIPILTDLFQNHILPGIKRIQDWINANPALTKTIVLVAGAVGGLAMIIGPLLMMLPALTSGVSMFGVALKAAMGPVGWITLAITVLTAGVVALATTWNNSTSNVVSDSRRQTDAINASVKAQKTALDDLLKKHLNDIALRKIAAEEQLQNIIKYIQGEYGLLESAHKNKMDLAREEAAAAKRALDNELDNVRLNQVEQVRLLREQYNEKLRALAETRRIADEELSIARRNRDENMRMFHDLYNQKIRALDTETDTAVKAYQDQIDALDSQTEKENRVKRRSDDQRRISELHAAIGSAKTAEEKTKAQAAFDEAYAQYQRDLLLQQREDEKNVLRQKINDLRTEAAAKKQSLTDDLDAERKKLDKQLQMAQEAYDDKVKKLEAEKALLDEELAKNIETQDRILKNTTQLLADKKAALDLALQEELKRLDEERQQKELQAQNELGILKIKLEEEERAIKESNARKLKEAEEHARRLWEILGWFYTPNPNPFTPPNREGRYAPHQYANGGLITQPTLLTRIGESVPYGIMAEKGPEAIVPRGGSFGSGILITGNNFNVRDDRDIDAIGEKLVGLIRRRTGMAI